MSGQTASMLLIAVLGCGPTVAAMCQVLCVEPPAAAIMHTAARTQHHHRMSQTNAASRNDRGGSVQPCDRAAVRNGAVANDIDAGAHASAPRDCCATLAQPPSATVARADATYVPPSDALVFAVLCEASTSHSQYTSHLAGSPPGRSSSRTPVILRV